MENNKIHESVKARVLLQELVEKSKQGNMSGVSDLIGSMSDSEKAWVLLMIAYGNWEDFKKEV